MASPIPIILSQWHHSFNKLQFSSQEFYSAVEQALQAKEIPKIQFRRVSFSEGGLLSSKREYLRVTRKEYVFDICAAPFGTDFFVSWWHGKTVGPLIEFTSRIPWLGNIIFKLSSMKSYYQLDSENMFKGAVRGSVLEAIDKVTTTKGLRSLSDQERMPINSN